MYTTKEKTEEAKYTYWEKVAFEVPDTWVKSVLSEIWGSAVSPKTWTKWKKDIYGKENFRGHKKLSKREAKRFFAYIYLRKKEPYSKIYLEEIDNVLDDYKFNDLLEQILIKTYAESVSGLEIPFYIEQELGRTVSYSTLYYWGKLHPKLGFSKKTMYSRYQVDQWIDIASKYA